MAGAAPFIGLAATGFQMAGSLMAGHAKAEQAAAQAGALENAAIAGRAKADQTSAQMGDNLTSTLANIAAVRAAAGTEPDSPSGQAIINRVRSQGEQQRAIKVGSIMAQVDEDEAGAAMARNQIGSDMLGGILGAGGSLFSGLKGIA